MTDSLETVKEAQAFREACAIRHGLSVDQLLSYDRTRPVYVARKAMMREMADAGWSYAAIGRATRRHHATVMHALGLLA